MSDANPSIDNLKLIYEIPLALLSFVFYKAMKFLLGGIYAIYLAVNKKTTRQWRVLSAEMLENPIALPVIMTKGPRWNTHAIVASAGPFPIQESLSVKARSAQKSSQSWTAAIYGYPGYETIANLGSLSSTCTEAWESLKLQPGNYTIVLRYYDWTDTVEFPAIKADDRAIIDTQTIAGDVNDFLLGLKQNKNWFYRGLHGYIFTILRLRRWLPESFVRREFLPVGDRDNQFGYGYLYRGEQLQTEFDPDVLGSYDIYLTLYNRSSFPTAWYQLNEAKHVTQPSETDSFYLLRFRQKARSPRTLCVEYDPRPHSRPEPSNAPPPRILRAHF